MTDLRGLAATRWRTAAARMVAFSVLWAMITGGSATELLPGVMAVLAAAWVSLRLLPPEKNRLAPFALCAWGWRFLRQSLFAGADVARRALDPALPLDPGFVAYSSGLAPGPARHLFTTVTSLLPGTLPAGLECDGALAVHCLDRRQPVAAQLAAEEALLLRVMGRNARDG
jgi:multicomponent Na+:H+ antiporter subunit E